LASSTWAADQYDAPYVLAFAKDQNDEQLCEIALSAAEVEKFGAAIKKRCAYHLVLDSDLPMKLLLAIWTPSF
jgi:hypothetical protein